MTVAGIDCIGIASGRTGAAVSMVCRSTGTVAVTIDAVVAGKIGTEVAGQFNAVVAVTLDKWLARMTDAEVHSWSDQRRGGRNKQSRGS